MYFSKTSVAFGLLATVELVAGHGAIVKAVGDAGGQGSSLGIDPNTPRDGSRRNPFQQDSTRFRGAAKATCGETLGGGDNDIQSGTQTVLQQNGGTLPQVSAGGELTMTVHQVNGDGAGPYECMIDATGQGTNWQPIEVTQQVPGNNGRSNARATDIPLKAAIPAGMQCTGTVAGQDNVCMVRCENPARAGPFGGCVPVQQVAAAGAGGNAGAGAGADAGAGAGAGAGNGAGNAGQTPACSGANAGAAGNGGNAAQGGANAGNGRGRGNGAAQNGRGAAADADDDDD